MKQPHIKQFDCVGIGLSSYDFSLQVAEHPALDSKQAALRYKNNGGGPVPGAIAILARLGCRTALITTMGNDVFGRSALKELKGYNVNVQGFRLDRKTNSLQSHILVDEESGKRTIVMNTEDIPEIQFEQIPDGMLESTSLITLDSRPTPEIIQAVKIARENGARVMLDAGSIHDLTEELLPLVDYPILSRGFVKEYFGHTNYERACQELIEMGAKLSGVTIGEDGSYLADQEQILYFPAYNVDVVDTTGAGDLYHGALMYGILHQWTLKAKGQFANAVAAYGCMYFGARTDLPDLIAAKEFMQVREVQNHPLFLEQLDIFREDDVTEL